MSPSSYLLGFIRLVRLIRLVFIGVILPWVACCAFCVLLQVSILPEAWRVLLQFSQFTVLFWALQHLQLTYLGTFSLNSLKSLTVLSSPRSYSTI